MFDPTQCESVSMAQAKAQEEQNPVNAALRATSIAFVTLAEAGQIDDTTATENVSQFASWAYPVAYAVGNIRQYNGELFRCVQAHTSQADWTPDATASLWKKVGDPTEEWPAWSQPIGAHDAYNSGDKVSHNGKHWTSNVDANVWEPGVYGWTEVSALIAYRLELLEKKVDKHNSAVERTFKLEEQAAVIEEKIKVANHRIEDLENR